MLKSIRLILVVGFLLATVQAELPQECFTSLVPNTNCNWYVQCLEQRFQCGS
jgi:hypothetical protein